MIAICTFNELGGEEIYERCPEEKKVCHTSARKNLFLPRTNFVCLEIIPIV